MAAKTSVDQRDVGMCTMHTTAPRLRVALSMFVVEQVPSAEATANRG